MSITRKGASLVVGAGAAVALVASAGSASATDPVDPGGVDPALTSVNLLNVNDFHGRIDTDGTGDSGKAFACTVVGAKADLGEDSTALLSAGDNIGASPFTSSSQEDLPTIEFLNALGLEASAVGNHEFDRGFDDLSGRVEQAAGFPNLGANVYDTGTTNPALDEYEIIEVNGLDVAVVGVVTQSTASLVSPQGIANIEFGDPVAAVNRVAGELSDGDAANGEADVIVAEYHEGATEGDDLSTLEDQVDAGGAFAKIVTDTSAEVDAIFTGHTHKGYAWDAPIPGGDGTRPIIQSNSYGETLGQLELGVDEETGEVTEYAATNIDVAESTDDCADDPTYTNAARIVDDAVAEADEIGREVVGEVSDDITTAHNDGERDDRLRESTLSNLTAEIWLDALNQPGRSGADIGIMNSGGLRDELLYEPTADEEPGEVTYAEAASINPFANTMMTVDLTGKQVITLLEQQWQPEGESRPFLKLGLSDNVTYTFDPDAAKGEHITSVTVDGEPIDESETYTVASGSFLIGGGDNFDVLAEGTNAQDTGLIDTDAFVDYFESQDVVEPDFRKKAIAVEDQPTDIAAGEEVSFTASDVDLTSLGSPENTELEAFVGDTSVGTFPITSDSVSGTPTRKGSAEISFTVPESVDTGETSIRLVAEPSDSEATLPVTVDADGSDSPPTSPGDEPGDGDSGEGDGADGDAGDGAESGDGAEGGSGDGATGPVVETDQPAAARSEAGVIGSGLGLVVAAGAVLVVGGVRRRAFRRH